MWDLAEFGNEVGSRKPKEPTPVSHGDHLDRIVLLLRDVFEGGEDFPDNCSFTECKKPPVEGLSFKLQESPLCLLKFSVGPQATLVMLVSNNRSIERETFLNDNWESFVGWVSYIKEIYEKEYQKCLSSSV